MPRQRVTSVHRTCPPRRLPVALCVLALALASGCGAIYPIKGIPASYLPPEYIGPSRDGLRPINPMLLTRSRPAEHLVDAGDVLTVYVPGVLGTATTEVHTIGETPPINFPFDPEMPPTIGFPIAVRGDGTISLPQVGAIPVRGMSLAQVEEAVRQAYMSPRQILPVGKERVLVSLQRPREYRVLVVREDSSTIGASTTSTSGQGSIFLGNTRRGTSRIVSLKAYENDVLHALSRVQGADGLPGLDAEGAIYVIRRHPRGDAFGSGCGAGAVGGFGSPWMSSSRPVSSRSGMATAGEPVVRFQSPEGDYRAAGGSAGYGGHSFAIPPSAVMNTGRYGAPIGGSAGPAGLTSPSAPSLASGRYGAPLGGAADNFPSSGAPLSGGGRYASPAIGSIPLNGPAPGNGRYSPTLSGGRYGDTPATGLASGPSVTPLNWTTISQGPSSAGNGRYASSMLPATPPRTSAPPMLAQGWDGPSPALEPIPTGDVASPMMPQVGSASQFYGGSPPPTLPAYPGPQGMPPGAGVYGAPLGASPMQTLPAAPFSGYPAPGLPPGQIGPSYGSLPTEDYFQSLMATGLDGTIDGPNVVRIPIRVGPGESPQITETDVTLEDGDIVFIEARSSEVFYTGGLLGGGQYTLPRDYDLRALEALSIAQSQGSRGGSQKSAGGVSAINQDVTISASQLVVVRKLADGTSVPIQIDLNRAKRDMTGRENIIIQPGDYLYLQYTCLEGVGAFFERHLLEGALFGLATAQFTSNGN